MRLNRRFFHPVCLGFLALALALLAWDTSLRMRWVDRITASRGEWSETPAKDALSPTGYALGQRNLVLPYQAVDGYHWIIQTQQMFARGEARVRHVDYDNAPNGREVHWASPFRWWLGAVAWVHHLFSQESLPVCVERAALYANPLLLVVSLLLLTPLIAQRFGPMAGAIVSLASVGIGTYSVFFAGAEPDHHGLATLSGLLSLLFLLAGGGGWLRQTSSANEPDKIANWLPTPRQARNWFIAAGVAGGIGLWISAASQVLVLVGIGCGAAYAVWLAKMPLGKPVAPDYEPRLWRIWGLAGAGTSVVTYLIEYFPAGSGWRLEVNHPLHALAWAGAGELLHCWARWRLRGKWIELPHDVLLLILAACAVATVPLVILVSHADTFWVADHFLFQLHKNYIEEFAPLLKSLSEHFNGFTVLLCLPMLVLPLALILFRREKSRVLRSLAALTFTPVLVLLVFALQQYRWLGVAYGLLLAGYAFLAWTGFELDRFAHRRKWVLALLAASCLSMPVRSFTMWRDKEFTTDFDSYQLAIRDLAHWLRMRTGTEPCTVASSPTLSSFFIFHGGLKGVGTFYWENLPGLRAAADLLAASNGDDAYRVVRERGITHLVMVSWDDFVKEYLRVLRDLPEKAEVPDDIFMLNLVKTKILPPWLRLLPYRFPESKALEGQVVYVFEVVPPQTQQESLVNLVNYIYDIGEVRASAKFLPALAQYPDNVSALVARCRILQGLRDQPSWQTAAAELRRRLPGASTLSIEDRIHAAMTIALAGDADSARSQFTLCLQSLDEHSLRHLSASAIYELLYFAPRLGVQSPEPSLIELAFGLLPVAMQEQLRNSLTQAQ